MSHMHLLLHLLHSRSFLRYSSLNQHQGQGLVCLVQELIAVQEIEERLVYLLLNLLHNPLRIW